MTDTTAPILVIGATGKTGRRIVATLTAQGHTVRSGSRTAPIPFDWDRPETWPAALEGVRSAYISYHPDLAMPEAPDRIAAVTQEAARAGVRRLVLLSGRRETEAERCEDIVHRSGLEYTLVRAAWFAQNFTEGELVQPVLQGVLPIPAGDVLEPIVDADDIADVAAASLVDDRHAGQLYDVTGPRLMSFAEVAATLSAAIGRPVQYAPITLEQFHETMVAMSGPVMADVLTHVCRETLDGRNATLGDGVRRALGREPRDFIDFCQAAARAGAWAQAA